MSESDKPTNDSLAATLIEGAETDNDSDEDIHYCKKCKMVFNNIQGYLEHKIRHDNFKVTYARSQKDRRMVLPKLVQKPVAATEQIVSTQTAGESKEADQMDSGKKKRKRKKHAEVDVQLIAERSTYICNSCDKKFNREATLRWHIKYEHNDQEEEEETREEVAVEADEELFVIKKEPGLQEIREIHVHRPKPPDEENSTRPYSCEHCGNRFKDVNVMKVHMLSHSNKRQFPCTYTNCPYAFKTKGSLVRHMRRHTGERPYSCDMCGRSFTESGALTRHMKSRTPCTAKSDVDLPRYRKKWDFVPNIPAVVNLPEGQHRVTTDAEIYTEVASLIDSVVTSIVAVENKEVIIEDTDPIEQVVTEVASSQESGEMLSLAAEEEAIKLQNLLPTQCRVCREDFLTLEVLIHHLRSHLADIPFRCGLCHFVTEKRDELQSHMLSHHQTQLKGFENGTVVAEVKEKTDTARDHRNAQLALRQLLEMPPTGTLEGESHAMGYAKALHRCPACSRTFRGSSYLKQHMKSHIGDRPHKCNLCEKSFISKDTLTKHLGVHSDERHYRCGECGKLFKRISHVREHLKIHSSERPFACSLCDKSFKTTNALKVHMRTHSDVMPYECRFCHRRFREKGSLARHVRSHTGERPYKCIHCNRGFSEHGTLNRHMKAKVPCSRQVAAPTESTADYSVEGESEYATVLAEFSSVVADTQHYLVPGQEEGEIRQDQSDQQTTEYVVVHTDLAETVQNVEIITEGEVDQAVLDQVSGDDGTSYIVVSDGSDSIRVLDPNTGQTVAVMPTESEEGQTMTIIPSENEIEAVAMAPLAEDNDAIQQAMMVANVVEEYPSGDNTVVIEEVS